MSRTNLKGFLLNEEWDAPFFKKLAHNDTGQARGHQGGMVIPTGLRPFLPVLDENAITVSTPTIDIHFQVKMYVGMSYLMDSTVRYQLQSWGGLRTPESRITHGFIPLRSKASEGDILIFQRNVERIDSYRLVLIQKSKPEFHDTSMWIGNRKWGVLLTSEQPVTYTQISQARSEILALEARPFELIRGEVRREEQKHSRIARSYVFRKLVLTEYNRCCAVSGIKIVTPDHLYEVESAHIIPLHEGGSDDIRNGIALTKTLHWAFDHGLFGIRPDRKIYLPEKDKNIRENAYLTRFENQEIVEARSVGLRIHQYALEWHFNNRVKQWD